MKNLAPIPHLGIALAGLGLAACQGTASPHSQEAPEVEKTPPVETTPAVTDSTPIADAPMELDDTQNSAWLYLAEKYDADGDGRVTAEEHGLEGGRDNFDRLDRDGDEVLTEEDYTSSGERMAEMMADRRAQGALFAHFQADDIPTTLEREELAWSFGEYDEDQDGQVTAEEFDLLADAKVVEISSEYGMGRMMNGDFQPWSALVERVDANGDQRLASTEVEAFFDERAGDDGVWELQSNVRPSSTAANAGEPVSGAKVGSEAPDFSLSPPEGGEAVALSSFKGKKPVALVFGSYT